MKRIGVFLPSLFLEKRHFSKKIFAPGELGVELCDELVATGHEVICYSTPGIKTKAHVSSVSIEVFEESFQKKNLSPQSFVTQYPEHFRSLQQYFELALAKKAAQDFFSGKIDVIHVMYGFSSLFLFSAMGINSVVVTVHDPISNDIIRYPEWVYRLNSELKYILISEAQKKDIVDISFFETVYNGVDTHRFAFCKQKQDYVAFAGRILPKKGVHIAIRAAKKAGIKLKIAGNVFGGPEKSIYFMKYIEPELGDGVEYVGFIDKEERISFFKNAKALLFPIQWEEPFGLVMIEAMSCGTPVIAFNKGSVPEVVNDGVTGYIVSNVDEMAGAIRKIKNIDPEACRKRAVDLFSLKVMTKKYITVYQKI